MHAIESILLEIEDKRSEIMAGLMQKWNHAADPKGD